MERFIDVRGYQWPARDTDCQAVVFGTVTDMEPALALCKGRHLAVQAGGNCGVWANWLAGHFATVITVEPDADNFECLEVNVARHRHVYPINAALGAEADFGQSGELVREDRNIGAHYVKPDLSGASGEFVFTSIDYLVAAHVDVPVDYLCLDIEGFELRALHGAIGTIMRWRPVIQVEDKGLSKHYGTQKGDIERWLAKYGYQVAARPHRDVILHVPGGSPR